MLYRRVLLRKESGNACGSETQAPECDVVGDMLVLSGLPEGCFRRLVFCVEDGIRWSSFQIGYAHICMRFQAVGRDVLFQCQAWKRQLYLSAASGNWHARKRLEKTVSLEASLWPMLLQLDGDRSKLVEEVKAHFVTKFSPELHCGDVLANLAHLPDVEPPFSAPEILECLRTMKMNKTTGMSKVSVELLKAVTAHEVGLASLRGILNDMLT